VRIWLSLAITSVAATTTINNASGSSAWWPIAVASEPVVEHPIEGWPLGRILGDPLAGTEHNRLADLLSASTAPRPRFSAGFSRQPGGRRSWPVAEGSDPQQARAALLAFEFRLSP
jgi:hypothetical protein